MKLKNLKRICSGEQLKEYCERFSDLGLEMPNYDYIVHRLFDINKVLFIDEDSKEFKIVMKQGPINYSMLNIILKKEDEEYKKENQEELIYVYSNLSDIVSYLMELERNGHIESFEYYYSEETDSYVSCFRQCEEEYADYIRLLGIKSHIESFGKDQSYTVSYNGRCGRIVGKTACPEKYLAVRRLSYLIQQFLSTKEHALITAYGVCGNETYVYDLEYLKEFKEFVLSLDSFDTIKLKYWCADTQMYQIFMLNVSGPKEDLVVVSFNLIECNSEDFPEVRTETYKFSSYGDAKDEYDRLIKPYVDKYGSKSGYEKKANEYIIEHEEDPEECAYGYNHTFDIRILGNKKFQCKCTLECM